MYDYEEYYEDDYDYEEDVINESALDMAMDMSDRYGVAIEDAYDFALESQKRTPDQRYAHRIARARIADAAANAVKDERDRKIDRYHEALDKSTGRHKWSNYTKPRDYVDRNMGKDTVLKYRTDASKAAFNAHMYPVQHGSQALRRFANSK